MKSPDEARRLTGEGQLRRLNHVLDTVFHRNPFYSRKLREAGLSGPVDGIGEFKRTVPFTEKRELIEDQAENPPYGTNLSEPLERYVRFHQTSGTTRRPLRWLDTPESWSWVVDNWRVVFSRAGAGPRDSVYFAFSFGPFLGFWSAMDAAQRIGCLCIPGGGISSSARLRSILDNEVTILCCTPTYALRMAETAGHEGVPIEKTRVRTIIVAGEPGGSSPASRRRIEDAWKGARVFDHHGMTEVGPVSYESPNHPGVLHVIESSYLAEVIDPETGEPAGEGRVGELVLTTLGREACPLLRYRTGDLVKPSRLGREVYGVDDLALEGGILGRIDDMVIIRGVNVYPGAVDEIVRSFEGVAEYQVYIHENKSLNEMRIEIEPAQTADPGALCGRVETALREAFNLRIPVLSVSAGALPRFEMKARRWNRIME